MSNLHEAAISRGTKIKGSSLANNPRRPNLFLLALSACFSLTGIPINLSVQAQEKTDKAAGSSSKPDAQSNSPTKAEKEIKACPIGNGVFESVPVFFSDPAKIKEILLLAAPWPAGSANCGQVVGINIGTPRSIAIYGNREGREALKRFIGSLDLPLERVNMDLWAIQISSASSARLSEVMSEVQHVVNQTREAMQETYKEFSNLSISGKKPGGAGAQDLVGLGFGDALALDAKNPTLSLTQMLLRLTFAGNTDAETFDNYDEAALNICNFFVRKAKEDPKYKLFNEFEGKELEAYNIKRIFNDDPPRAFRRPFQGFMTTGLHQTFNHKQRQPACGDSAIDLSGKNYEKQNELLRLRRNAIIEFAKQYKAFDTNYHRDDPTLPEYDPKSLAKAAAVVDGMMNPVVQAINRDIEDYFLLPTLFKIRQIVGRNRGVEYAEVGRTSIAGINGLTVEVKSGISSAFDQPTPLRLSNWLKDASEESSTINNLFPELQAMRAGPVSASQALALLSALSREESRWEALDSGITLNLTPILMRDQSQAEVDVDLSIGYPETKDESKKPTVIFRASDDKAKPRSRIAQSSLKTKVYVNTMDLFALSSFSNQTTVTGGRWYVPLVGTIWEGFFGDIPVLGGWFSFKRKPQNMQHQSIVLANTLIVPSAMGMASYVKDYSNPRDASLHLHPGSIPNSIKIDRGY